MAVKTFAAIDVGSFELSMKIFEFTGKSQGRVIEHIRQRVDLGSDTYRSGKISLEKMDELCRVLSEFAQIMDSYKVSAYRAYGTSAIRETENTSIVLDQIRQRTGIKVEVLSNSEQRFLDYKAIAFRGETFRSVIEEGTAIVDIGGGSIQLSLFDNDTLVSTQNLRIGVLRIQELLHHMNTRSSQREELIDEIVSAQLATYKKLYLKDREIKTIIVVDDYLSVWVRKKAASAGRKNDLVNLGDYEQFIQQMRTKPLNDIIRMLDVSEESANLTFISACIVKRIMKLTGAQQIWAPGVTLSDGMAYEYAEQNRILLCEHDFNRDILACAMNIGKRYQGSRKRAETLEDITLTIFDSMKKIHGLGKRERLYLQLASLLHDCGKYISLVNIGETSYQIIMATEMIGLSHMEREIVASVVRFNHTPFIYYTQMKAGGTALTEGAYLTVAKLTAILRIANALDRSHKQKLKGVKAALKEEQLVLMVETPEDITLERGIFEEQAHFFQEVFSVQPVIKQKKPM
ncbi:MAG: exopolyphosphatase [Lachnospiraceae bacterium]|nr:exopolyphosphatase [Lachnospiraceae bacterium]